MTTVPEPFVEYGRSSRYLDLIGPLYEHRHDGSVVGLVIDDRHTNSRGMLHGGLLVAIADTVMGHTTERTATERRLLTVSLTTDFVGSGARRRMGARPRHRPAQRTPTVVRLVRVSCR